jgi:hypothetical protein
MQGFERELAIGKSLVVGAARGALGVGGAKVKVLGGVVEVEAPTVREAQELLKDAIKETKELVNYLPPILLKSSRTKEFLSEEAKKELGPV